VIAFGAQERRDLLVDLIELRLPLSEAVAAVRELPWDSDVELVLLTRASVGALLQLYLRGELSPADLETWANAVEGRDDIGAEPGYEELLRAFVFETANPLLAEPISDSYARRWLESLSGDPLPPSAKG
jgi:hypothetical protein